MNNPLYIVIKMYQEKNRGSEPLYEHYPIRKIVHFSSNSRFEIVISYYWLYVKDWYEVRRLDIWKGPFPTTKEEILKKLERSYAEKIFFITETQFFMTLL